MEEKQKRLEALLEMNGPLAVAFSGGTDSAFLLAVARRVLADNVTALTSAGPMHPARERAEAARMAAGLGVRHILVETGRMADGAFAANRPDRCYVCKKMIWAELKQAAAKLGIGRLADGVCADDLNEHRPGLAAGDEAGIISPLALAGFSKPEIREASRRMGLFTWDKPAGTCLATRIPYGTPITPELLAMIEQAEEVLIEAGYRPCRVRCHGKTARIEVAAEAVESLAARAVRDPIVQKLRRIGFSHVALDLAGYRSGSMDGIR
ncbi:MAG: ATP-dependent sacrificial sulfur transferase LarE [Thermodesulfobacteriota bacterium]